VATPILPRLEPACAGRCPVTVGDDPFAANQPRVGRPLIAGLTTQVVPWLNAGD
jgi:hypothetical protein